MDCALGEVRDGKAYVAGLEVPPTGRCAFLEGLRINLRINFPSSDHLELETNELWRAYA